MSNANASRVDNNEIINTMAIATTPKFIINS